MILAMIDLGLAKAKVAARFEVSCRTLHTALRGAGGER